MITVKKKSQGSCAMFLFEYEVEVVFFQKRTEQIFN